ncbi:Steroid 21-hydroxylase [Varanus komodoensis]|nr:Steroid 21-hydroxylase [Varanus komodoensis]
MPANQADSVSLSGFSIPRGTTVIPNLYGAHHDQSKWQQPLEFRPGSAPCEERRFLLWEAPVPGVAPLPWAVSFISDKPCLSSFRLERFLEGSASAKAQRHLVPFSCGVRICLGEAVARMESFLFLAHILRDFQILPSTPGCLPDLQEHFGFLVQCKPFTVRLVPRLVANPAE